jgi:hypothetical protein
MAGYAQMEFSITHSDASNIWVGFKLAVLKTANDAIWGLGRSIFNRAVQRHGMKPLALLFLMENR